VAIALEGAFVFFGLLLASVAIAAYEDFTDAREKTAAEASELASLYRGVSGYPEPVRGQLQADLRDYTKYQCLSRRVRGHTARCHGCICSASLTPDLRISKIGSWSAC
jgi:hypothetical protein